MWSMTRRVPRALTPTHGAVEHFTAIAQILGILRHDSSWAVVAPMELMCDPMGPGSTTSLRESAHGNAHSVFGEGHNHLDLRPGRTRLRPGQAPLDHDQPFEHRYEHSIAQWMRPLPEHRH